jgi:selenocysteine-specific elongation factor
MKHLIMGTAGHVDHGKTALVKALTGIDCDTDKQEKQRGLTINLGFAHLPLSSGDTLGIIDVPGHRDFIHTMVGGASGIDLALLVVAADSGVMPQTREHLQIMEVLGIRGGLVALTRIDLAPPDLVAMAEEEIRDFLRGSFLDGCPVVRVSSVTGEGIEDLKRAITQTTSRHENRYDEGVFRLFVDRIFTVSGFGTVVAGSVTSGKLHVGDTAYLLPGAKKPLRVRRLERYGEEVQEVVAGDRGAMNLTGLNRTDFERGQVISDRVLRDTTILDASLRLFEHDRKLGIWSQVEFHLGTYENQAKVHLLDGDGLTGGDTGMVQIHLETPCVVRSGDRFVIRSTASDLTLGGGEVVDPSPLHHRRRRPKLIHSLARLTEGGLPELIAAEVRKHPCALSYEEIAQTLNILPGEVRGALAPCLPEGIVCHTAGDQSYLIDSNLIERLGRRALEAIADFHRQNPLSEKGRTTEELVGLVGLGGDSALVTVQWVLANLEAEGKIKKVGRTWALTDRPARPDPRLEGQVEFVANYIAERGMNVPRMSEIVKEAARQGINQETLDQILRALVERKAICFADDIYLPASLVASCRDKLLRTLAERDEGMTVAEFRDLVSGSRKTCLALLSLFDAEGVTRRVGDLRMLTRKGRDAVQAEPLGRGEVASGDIEEQSNEG